MRLNKQDVGKLCLIKWDDIGRVDSMIVDIDDDRKGADVFDFSSKTLRNVDLDQIVQIDGFVTPNGILPSLVRKMA